MRGIKGAATTKWEVFMTTAKCRRGGKKHTPIVSKKQRGLFGAELARRRAGKRGLMPGITAADLASHLEESKGKKLPKKARKRKKR